MLGGGWGGGGGRGGKGVGTGGKALYCEGRLYYGTVSMMCPGGYQCSCGFFSFKKVKTEEKKGKNINIYVY